MANEKVKFTAGQLANLPATKKAGMVYFAIDGDNTYGNIYFDKDNSTRIQMSNAVANIAINDIDGNPIVDYIKSGVTSGTYGETFTLLRETGQAAFTYTIPSTIVATLIGNADTATKLKNARTIRTNLASTSTASFDGSDNITPGVTGTLGVGNGGTGISTYTLYNMLYASATNVLSQTSKILTNGSVLTIGNTALKTGYDLYVENKARAKIFNVADKVELQYNATNESLNFVFV